MKNDLFKFIGEDVNPRQTIKVQCQHPQFQIQVQDNNFFVERINDVFTLSCLSCGVQVKDIRLMIEERPRFIHPHFAKEGEDVIDKGLLYDRIKIILALEGK